MKKVLSAVIAAVMLTSSFALTASAANNGPQGYSDQYAHFVSSISLYDTDENGNIKQDYDPDTGLNKARTVIYAEDGIKNITGAVYDEKSNTLTLTDYNAPDKLLQINAMGDDFKIQIEGKCAVAGINIYSSQWSASVTFTGTGTLTINGGKTAETGLYIGSYGVESKVTFDKGVKVNINGKENSVFVANNKQTDAGKVFEFNGAVNSEVTSENCYDVKREYGSGCYIDRTTKPDYIGPKATYTKEPGELYVMGESTSTSSDGVKKKGHWINHVVYSESLGLYVFKPFENGSTTKYSYEGDEDYNDYVESEGSLYNEKKRMVEGYSFKKMVDSNGKKYAYGDAYDGADGTETNYVVTYSEVKDVAGLYVFTVVKSGEEADEFAKTLKEEDLSWQESTVSGIFVKELSMDNEGLGRRVTSKEDPDGIYFMTEGTKYENYGTPEEKEIPMRWVRKYLYFDKYDIYIQDKSFGNDFGDLEIPYDDFDKSGYTLSDGEKYSYNKGTVQNLYGTIYVDKNGKQYFVASMREGSEYVKKAFDFEELSELKTNDEKTYLCTLAENVDPEDLTAVEIKTVIEGIKNYYINSQSFTYDGGSAPVAAKTDLSKAKISKIKDTVYTGKALKPGIKVTLSGKTLKNGTDYKVTYKNNKKVGKATVTVTGTGNYEGTVKTSFNIIPKGTSISKIKGAKKAFTVNWKKNTAQTKGYQLQYSLKSNFKSAKSQVISKTKTTSATIKKLKSKKTYYVRVRTFSKVSGKTYYSAWSKAKSVKTK